MYALSTSTQTGAARGYPFAGTQPDHSLQALFRSQPRETFPPKRAVFWEGDPAHDVFEVTRGVLRVFRILPDGRRAIVGFIFPGDVIGLSFRDKYLFTAEAVTEVGIRRMPRSRFQALVDDAPALRSQVLSKLRDEMCAAQDQMLLLLHRSAEERVASFLRAVAKRAADGVGRGARIDLAMSRTDIADYLGLTIETVCRAITKLRADGVISLDGPHRITIEKPGTLRALAGEIEATEEGEAPRAGSTRAAWPH